MPDTPVERPRCASAKTPKVTDSSTGTPLRELTCAEMRITWPSITARKRYPDRRRMSRMAMRTIYSVDRDLPQQIEVREHLAGPQHHGRERIFRHRERQARFLAQPLVEILEHRPAARQH